MTDLTLFRITPDGVEQCRPSAHELEKSLQTIMERHLEPLLGVRFLASEYSTGKRHGGRIDTLGIDENGCPVIIEYKRQANQNVINQGLFYLDWLLDHQAEFWQLVMKRMGREQADAIDWSSCRLLCIARGFTRYDEHAVEQIDRNIELIRYTRYGDDLLLLDLVNSTVRSETSTGSAEHGRGSPPSGGGKVSGSATVEQQIDGLAPAQREVFDALDDLLQTLGEDVRVKRTKLYLAYRRLKNFACVRPSGGRIVVWARLDPDHVELVEGFTRNVREVGHYGTGDLEITIASLADLERAKPLLLQSYEQN